jgi:hypothetical protein
MVRVVHSTKTTGLVTWRGSGTNPTGDPFLVNSSPVMAGHGCSIMICTYQVHQNRGGLFWPSNTLERDTVPVDHVRPGTAALYNDEMESVAVANCRIYPLTVSGIRHTRGLPEGRIHCWRLFCC